jgi:hypothetical protein
MNPLESLTRLLPPGLRNLGWRTASPEQSRHLAEILQLDPGELGSIRIGPRYHYRPFTIAKPDGRDRRLLAPSPALKRLQQNLLHRYLADLAVHECATAFRPGLSVVDNARPHARQQLIATVDVRDFFESTRAARVRAFFARQGWTGFELETLMRLCVFRNGLPQGAPTSPCLSNLVNFRLDERLARLAGQSGAAYTRYADDLTFSWSTDCLPGGFRDAVEDALHRGGYEVQPCKGWRISGIGERPCVTGMVLRGQGRLGISWKLRWQIWKLRWKSWWSADEQTLARLNGCLGYRRMVTSW